MTSSDPEASTRGVSHLRKSTILEVGIYITKIYQNHQGIHGHPESQLVTASLRGYRHATVSGPGNWVLTRPQVSGDCTYLIRSHPEDRASGDPIEPTKRTRTVDPTKKRRNMNKPLSILFSNPAQTSSPLPTPHLSQLRRDHRCSPLDHRTSSPHRGLPVGSVPWATPRRVVFWTKQRLGLWKTGKRTRPPSRIQPSNWGSSGGNVQNGFL